VLLQGSLAVDDGGKGAMVDVCDNAWVLVEPSVIVARRCQCEPPLLSSNLLSLILTLNPTQTFRHQFLFWEMLLQFLLGTILNLFSHPPQARQNASRPCSQRQYLSCHHPWQSS
jgi:hypothetical protein